MHSVCAERRGVVHLGLWPGGRGAVRSCGRSCSGSGSVCNGTRSVDGMWAGMWATATLFGEQVRDAGSEANCPLSGAFLALQPPPPRPLLTMLLSLTLRGECAVCAHTLLAAAHSCGHTGAALPPLLGRDCRWTDLPRFQGPRTPTLTLGTAEGREPSWRTRLVEVAAGHCHLCPA